MKLIILLAAGSSLIGWANVGLAEPRPHHLPGAVNPLTLSAVRLTGGPLKQAQDLNAKYLLALEPDRIMAGYRLRPGWSRRPRVTVAGTPSAVGS